MKLKDRIKDKFGYDLEAHSALQDDKAEGTIKEALEICKPKIILEIGTFQGLSARYFAELGYKVITIDKKQNKIAEEILEEFRDVKYYHKKEIPERILLLNSIHCDFVFIDAEYEYNEIGSELEITLDKADNILFHDYPADPLVMKIVERYPKKNIITGNGFALYTKNIAHTKKYFNGVK